MTRVVSALGVVSLATLAASAEPLRNTDWVLIGKDEAVSHHSRLTQINESNVGRLGIAWVGEIPSLDGLVGNPLVKDGIVFQSGSLARVYATDVRTGKIRWIFDPKVEFNEKLSLAGYWSARYNRGVALAGSNVYVGTGDCRIIAIDQESGRKVWEAQSCDSSQFYGITSAPRVGGGMVFTGNNCADSGTTRGFVDAFDAATGKRRWRFYTVPGDPKLPPEDDVQAMAAKTWGANWYEKTKGCGSAWDALTYDPELKRLYIGTAGPAPWSPSMRAADAGDELFTNSIVAVDAETGKYIWHYKTTPNDGWNFDATSQMTLASVGSGSAKRRVIMTAPKNGFFYVLDAQTGKLVSAKNYTPVNWASGIDLQTGRPILMKDARYWERLNQKNVVSPGPLGARSWQAMSYSANTGLVYLGVGETPTTMTIDPKAIVGGMSFDMYYGLKGDPKWPSYGELVAWDPIKQEARWRIRRPLALNGGTLSTAGNLVFQGTADGKFEAFAADSGKRLFSYDVGASIQAAPTTVMVDGEQLVLVPVGNAASAAVGVYLAKVASKPATRSASRLLAFKLNGTTSLAHGKPIPWEKPPLPRPDSTLVRQGALLTERHMCVDCHGLELEAAGGSAPDLRRASAETYELFGGIVIGGMRAHKGMPAFPDLTIEEVEAIRAFVLDEAWKAYEAHERPTENR